MEFTLEPTKVTKEFIFNKIREEQIMEHYLGVQVKKGLLKSPLRSDSSPTCSFYKKSNGPLMFKDFRGDFCGDCISVVMYKFNCNYTNALKIICNDFNLISNINYNKNSPLIEYSNNILSDYKESDIQIQKQDFLEFELIWWSQYGITEEILKKFRVFSCKNIFLNSKLFSSSNVNKLTFGYYGGVKEDLQRWRIYFPNNNKYRFISNWKSKHLQGAHMVNKDGGDLIVITKSLKDVMTLYSLGITSVAPISENCFVSEDQYDKLKLKFKNIILFYDNDLPGITSMNKIRKKFSDVIIFYIPKIYEAKDISDFYKKHGGNLTKEFINIQLEKLKTLNIGKEEIKDNS